MRAAAVDNVAAAAKMVMSLRLVAVVSCLHFENAISFDNHSSQRRVTIEMNLDVTKRKENTN